MNQTLLPSSLMAEIYSWDPTFHIILQDSLDTIKKRVATKIAQRYHDVIFPSPSIRIHTIGYFHFEYDVYHKNKKSLEKHLVTIEELPSTVLHRHFKLTDLNKTIGSWKVYHVHFLFFEI